MSGPSERDVERRLNDLEGADPVEADEVNLSDEAAEAVRYVTLYRRDGQPCDLTPEIVEEALAELDDELEEAYRREIRNEEPA